MKTPKLFLPITLVILFLNIATTNVFAQSVKLCIKGVVVYIGDNGNLLNGGITVGDSLKGTVAYDLGISEDNSHSNTVPQVGDYYNTSTTSGFIVKINNYKFQTDSNNVEIGRAHV